MCLLGMWSNKAKQLVCYELLLIVVDVCNSVSQVVEMASGLSSLTWEQSMK